MGKREVKLKYKDMLAIKHALMASVAAKKNMVEKFEQKGLPNVAQLKKDIDHEANLVKYVAAEAKAMLGGDK